ncbi:hypothetical protein T4B_6944 [Trichinella pseudospiralis]|uniref:Uncharacterized protein n=1 Tax=Trichinella pseudospiralis TaxID=6337 RepID=A0A0V1JUQ5_TRIPS|nr:hypothetical protein T4B_9726 [Trichinella pseudospiralis]KRZ26310.1 hypothetical protein T4B_6944 [Trichinella pseudospiralis]KRZ38690.1 hypothetical protein T4C_13135 [Trichinella pseudospiralis]
MRQTTGIGWKFLQLRPTSYVSTYRSTTSASYHDASYQNFPFWDNLKYTFTVDEASDNYIPQIHFWHV